MTINKSIFNIIGILYFIVGLIYYYIGYKIPIEITWSWLRIVIILSFLVSPLLVGIIIGNLIPDKFQKNRLLGCISPLSIFILTIHHLFWTFIVLWQTGGYEDKDINYPDMGNKRHKIITQFKDEGATGGHSRIIEVYEFSPFMRYVYNVEYLD